jgi:4-amino-4-deoxy-L-arabinose transferase-like glycosyltransferase
MKSFRNYFLIGLAAFLLRILFLGKQSLWMDEGFSVWMASHTLSALMKLIPDDAHPFIFYTFLHYWMKWGHDSAYLRFPSVICGVISCLVVYALGKELLGEKQGLLTAIFWVCSMEALNADTEIRMYAYATCFALLSTFWFWRAYKQGGWKNWVLYYLFASLSLYTHYYTGFIIMGQWIFLLTQKRWKEAVWVPLILTLIFSPWTPVFFLQFFHAIDANMLQITWYASFTYFGFFLNARWYFMDRRFFVDITSFFSIAVLILGSINLFKKKREEAVFLMLLFGIPFFIPFCIAHFTPRHIFIFRYLVLLAPYFSLLFIYGLFNVTGITAYPIYAALLFVNVSLRILLLTGPGFQKQNWREAARIVANDVKKVKVIFVEQGMSIYPLWFYLSRYFPVHWMGKRRTSYFIIEKNGKSFIPVISVSGTSIPQVKNYVNLEERGGGRIWLVLCQPFLVDHRLKVLHWFLRHQKVLHFYKLRSISKINVIQLYLVGPLK